MATAAAHKKVAVLQGEVDGLVCKVNGFERALQDAEMELAERDLQVVLLKSFIRDLDNPSDLQASFHAVLQHNTCLQQQVQELTLQAHSSPAAAPNPSASAAVQLTLLRTALTEANYRLAAAGLAPVAATSMQEAGMQDSMSTANLGIPTTTSTGNSTGVRHYSRLFRTKYSVDSSSASASTNSMTPSGSISGRESPCAPALCLLPKLSRAAAQPTDTLGPDTPVGISSKPPTYACTDPSSSSSNSDPQPAALTAAGNMLPLPDSPAATASSAATTGPEAPAGVSPKQLVRSTSGFRDVEPYSYDGAADFSDDGTDLPRTDSSKQQAFAVSALTSISTPPCSPCSSIEVIQHSHARLQQLPGLQNLPNILCSCDNPLFAEEEDLC